MLGTPVTVTPPAGELIPLEAAKAYLRVEGTALDGEVQLTLDAAVEDLQLLTGTRLLNQTVTVTAHAFEDLEVLKVAPVRAVTEIAYEDSSGTPQLVDPDSFELFGAPFEQRLRLVPGSAWPMARAGSIVATLEVGYGASPDDVPPKLRFAAFALLRAKFEQTDVDLGPLVSSHRFWL